MCGRNASALVRPFPSPCKVFAFIQCLSMCCKIKTDPFYSSMHVPGPLFSSASLAYIYITEYLVYVSDTL